RPETPGKQPGTPGRTPGETPGKQPETPGRRPETPGKQPGTPGETPGKTPLPGRTPIGKPGKEPAQPTPPNAERPPLFKRPDTGTGKGGVFIPKEPTGKGSEVFKKAPVFKTPVDRVPKWGDGRVRKISEKPVIYPNHNFIQTQVITNPGHRYYDGSHWYYSERDPWNGFVIWILFGDFWCRYYYVGGRYSWYHPRYHRYLSWYDDCWGYWDPFYGWTYYYSDYDYFYYRDRVTRVLTRVPDSSSGQPAPSQPSESAVYNESNTRVVQITGENRSGYLYDTSNQKEPLTWLGDNIETVMFTLDVAHQNKRILVVVYKKKEQEKENSVRFLDEDGFIYPPETPADSTGGPSGSLIRTLPQRIQNSLRGTPSDLLGVNLGTDLPSVPAPQAVQ
ncbi:MAG: hypothetical protein HY399_05125, partial [Elusimicrobia bacterium]|nr:hypothetical protein [Elusimicrobiota bacterium]